MSKTKPEAKPEHSKHAPEPWTYRRMQKHYVVEASNGVRVATVRYVGRPDGSTSAEQARLIAEAPAMLAILRELSRWFADPDRYSGDAADIATDCESILARIERD